MATKSTGSAGVEASKAAPNAARDGAKPARTQVGMVESDKRNKTRRVVVRFQARHAKYGKYIASRTILHVHDENNESHTGDTVEVAECRPISKTKFWRLVRVVARGQSETVSR